MKKITFLLTLVAITAVSFAQTVQPIKAYSGDFQKEKHVISSKARGDIIWSEDFDGAVWESTTKPWIEGLAHDDTKPLPTHANGGTWQFKDNTDKSFYWHWSNHGPRGRYVTGSTDCNTPLTSVMSPDMWPEGTSVDNGVMLFEADYFFTDKQTCVYDNGSFALDSYIQFGPIDFSANPNVALSIKTVFRFYGSNGKLQVQFSSDYNPTTDEGTWGTPVVLNVNTPSGDVTHSAEKDAYRIVSSEVGGKSNVYFRVSFVAADDYYAIIDDIKFVEPEANDLMLTDWWCDYMVDAEETSVAATAAYNSWGGYTKIPQSVVSNFLKFRASATNLGYEEAVNAKLDVEILKDGTSVYDVSGPDGKNLASGENDTLRVVADYTPAEKGHYQVSMDVKCDAQDATPINNNFDGYEFDVVDALYSRVNHGKEDKFINSGAYRYMETGEGDVVAQRYSFGDNVEGGKVTLKGISVFIGRYDEANYADQIAAIEAGDFSMTGKVWEFGDEIVFKNIETNPYTLEIGDTGTWVTLDFKDQNLIVDANKDYLVGFEGYTGANNANDEKTIFRIGADKTNKIAGLSFIYRNGPSDWIATNINFAIDLVLDVTNGIANGESNVFAGLSLYPNPVNDELVISGLNSNIKTVTISNVIGQTVMTVPAENASTISLGNLNKGVYLVTFVDSQNNVETKRIIKN